MKARAALLLLPLAVMLCQACGDDEEALPPYMMELADVTTDANGLLDKICTDDGDTLIISNKVGHFSADTTLRAVATYVVNYPHAQLQGLQLALCLPPLEYQEGAVKTDPLDVVTCWQGGKYINFRLALKTGGKAGHKFGFIDHGLSKVGDAYILKVELLHDQNGDPEYYTRESYISCDASEGASQGNADSIEITVNTYSGLKTYKYSIYKQSKNWPEAARL